MTTDPDRLTRPRSSGHYAVTAEGSDTRLVTEYSSRAAAVLALEREIDRLQAGGAIIEGDLASGYTARWEAYGQPVRLRLTLSEVLEAG